MTRAYRARSFSEMSKITLPVLCLLGFTAWTMLLVGALAIARAVMVLQGFPTTGFHAEMPHGGERYRLLQRAHLNAAENLPVFATLVLVGTLLHVDNARFQSLPVIILAARLLQSVAHIASGHATAANVRIAAFFTQMVCFLLLLVEILRHTVR